MEHGRYVKGPFATLKACVAEMERWAKERAR
jgi:hypothetical protein